MKSKSVLNEKIDCNILKIFKFPSSILKRYFVAHYETLRRNMSYLDNEEKQ